ncbi:MAG: hypothetical protein R3C99_09210 [Pirellulaceae bacterium]
MSLYRVVNETVALLRNRIVSRRNVAALLRNRIVSRRNGVASRRNGVASRRNVAGRAVVGVARAVIASASRRNGSGQLCAAMLYPSRKEFAVQRANQGNLDEAINTVR